VKDKRRRGGDVKKGKRTERRKEKKRKGTGELGGDVLSPPQLPS